MFKKNNPKLNFAVLKKWKARQSYVGQTSLILKSVLKQSTGSSNTELPTEQEQHEDECRAK